MRDISREEWVALYRKYLQNRGPIDAGECPASDEIFSFFEQKTLRQKKYRLLRHILDCEVCRDEFECWHELELRVAGLRTDMERLELKSSVRSGLPKSASKARSSVRRWAWAGMGLAAILAGFLLIVPTRRFPDNHKPTYRGSPQHQFRDVYPPLGAIVRRADLHFSWKSPLPGGSFILELFDPTMALLWRGPAIKETETRIPENILQSMKEEQVYFWSISGTGNDQTIIESLFYSFRLVR
jgi:hypothetical protein